jgi:N-methylhydantoinase B
LFYAGNDTRPGKGQAWFQLFQIGFGGIPGRPLGDGPDGHSLWPGFTNVPNEFLERYFPMMIERYSTEPDSGGAGLHRGGNGIHMTYRFLSAGTIAIHDDRWFVPPWGVNGGDPGKRARKILEKADGTTQIVGNKVEDLAVEAGDRLHFITWGGGGWGDRWSAIRHWSARKSCRAGHAARRARLWRGGRCPWRGGRGRDTPCARTCARSGRRLAGVQHRAGA